jgi:two-component system LytT family sensor kinase
MSGECSRAPVSLGDQFLLTTLIVKLAVMAVLATMLARYHRFRHILIFERRGWLDRLVFTLALGIPLMAGVTARLLLNYKAADLSLEGAFLAGLIAGPYAGAHRRRARRRTCLNRGRAYRASLRGRMRLRRWRPARGMPPRKRSGSSRRFVFIDLHKHVWGDGAKARRQLAVVAAARTDRVGAAAAGARRTLRRQSPLLPWRGSRNPVAADDDAHHPGHGAAVATPIKIWNSARIEHRVQEQEKLLLAAKIEALKSQINPHFLFNTLTSISSLIRSQPETARPDQQAVGLLRRLLRSHEHFVTLREELESVDEYLDIEVVRFGPKLRVRKEVAPDTVDVVVPSMILQPLVENSIKHGPFPARSAQAPSPSAAGAIMRAS